MNFVDNTAKFIAEFEGYHDEVYKDIAGIPTIGFGRTGKDVHMGMPASNR